MNWKIDWKIWFFCQAIFSLSLYVFTKNIEIQILFFNYTLTIVYLNLWRTGDKNV